MNNFFVAGGLCAAGSERGTNSYHQVPVHRGSGWRRQAVSFLSAFCILEQRNVPPPFSTLEFDTHVDGSTSHKSLVWSASVSQQRSFLSHVWCWKHSQVMIQCRRQEIMRFCPHLPRALFPGALSCSLFSYLCISLIYMSLFKYAVSHTPAVCLSPGLRSLFCSSCSVLFLFFFS